MRLMTGTLPFTVLFRGVIRGFHVYKDIWDPELGEELHTQQEHGNPEDAYAAAVINGQLDKYQGRYLKPVSTL